MLRHVTSLKEVKELNDVVGKENLSKIRFGLSQKTKLVSFHQLSRRSNFSFDIFKKTVDVGKDVLRTHATWLSFFNRYLPLLGLSIALISFGLQAAVIIFDPKIDRDTKVANGLFLACFVH